VRDMLLGREIDTPGGLGDTPDYTLLDVYDKASGRLQDKLVGVVQRFLEDMADNPESEWRKENPVFSLGDRLVFVARGMKDGSFVYPIRRMVDSGDFVGAPGELPGGLHARLLQALLNLGVQEDVRFWRAQVRACPDCLMMAIRGLGEAGGRSPFCLLLEVDVEWTPELTAALRRVVTALRLKHRTGWGADAAERYTDLMPPEVAEQFGQAAGSRSGVVRQGPWARTEAEAAG